MERDSLLVLLDEAFELPEGTLNGSERLEDVGWSSLTMMTVIALVDERCNVTLSPRQFMKCQLVEDLLTLAGAAA